jgi:hypothetical protein
MQAEMPELNALLGTWPMGNYVVSNRDRSFFASGAFVDMVGVWRVFVGLWSLTYFYSEF